MDLCGDFANFSEACFLSPKVIAVKRNEERVVYWSLPISVIKQKATDDNDPDKKLPAKGFNCLRSSILHSFKDTGLLLLVSVANSIFAKRFFLWLGNFSRRSRVSPGLTHYNRVAG